MTGSTRGFDGLPADVNATTIRNPRDGSDSTRPLEGGDESANNDEIMQA